MKSVSEIVSPYRGSEATYEMIRQQIAARWGDEVAEEFDPYTDAAPLVTWAKNGYRVKKGEKSLKSVTYVEVKDPEDKSKIIRKIRRTVHLFHKKQVEKV